MKLLQLPENDSELQDFARKNGFSIWHPSLSADKYRKLLETEIDVFQIPEKSDENNS